jgi:hypothetical protein
MAVNDGHPLKHAIGVEERENDQLYLQVRFFLLLPRLS